MKLQDFDFRLVMSEAFMKNHIKCEHKECQCAEFKSLVYGKEAVLSFADLIFEDNEAQLELYTGFKDKNGVKIFENDIVLFIPNGSEKFLHTINYDKERGFFFSDDCNLDDEYCEGCTEVIGNIHKNKELVDFMEKEKKAFKKFHQKFENKYDENGKPVKEFYEENTRLSIYFKQELEKLLDDGLYK
ncbi:hypothetical protein G3D81_001742 [Campylobacter upsaliensis]|nr:hypothetical protein [Campylobacter upsaliensis]